MENICPWTFSAASPPSPTIDLSPSSTIRCQQSIQEMQIEPIRFLIDPFLDDTQVKRKFRFQMSLGKTPTPGLTWHGKRAQRAHSACGLWARRRELRNNEVIS